MGQLDDTGRHRITVERLPGRPIKFRGVCSCGETSDVMANTGRISGWEERHRNLHGDMPEPVNPLYWDRETT